MKWKASIALVVIIFTMVSQIYWMWAIVFMFWVIPDLKRGVIYLIEPVERKKHPILYWGILATWMLYSTYLIVQAFFPQLLY